MTAWFWTIVLLAFSGVALTDAVGVLFPALTWRKRAAFVVDLYGCLGMLILAFQVGAR